MKKTHIILLIVIALSISIIMSMVVESSTFETFSSEKALSGKEITINGNVVKGKPIEYQPEIDANHFSFYMKDQDGVERKVVVNTSVPQDFERVEQLTVNGKLKGEEFYASNLIMKCPSKYDENEVVVVEAEK